MANAFLFSNAPLPQYDAIGAASTSSVNPTARSSLFSSNFDNASLFSVATLLPEYSAVDTLGEQPPTGTRAHQFQYSYPIRPKNPWATLHLHTRDAAVPGDPKSLQNRPRVPRFWSCDPLSGAVQLDLDSPQNIQTISITLHGAIVLSFHTGGYLPFLKREFTVWDKQTGDPLQSDNTTSNDPQKKKTDARLVSGQHTFPFSFPFPTTADPVFHALPSENGPKNTGQQQRRWNRRFTSGPDQSSPESSDHPHTPLGSGSLASPMPQTFMEKDIDPNVVYNVSVRIVHGRFKTNSKIKTNIAYFPASEPLPMPQKRREAYGAGALIPSPMDDPEGWLALPTVKTYGVVKIDGNLVHTRVDCTLYIAQPLSYSRRSPIPCFITIHSDGVEVAHLLPSTESPTVRLLRQIWHPLAEYEHSAPETTAGHHGFNASFVHTMVPTSDLALVAHDVGHANWWTPSKAVAQGPNTRHLEGEIHLSPDLQPSCGFQAFRIEYAVELLTFQTANFKPDLPAGHVLRKGPGDNVVASKPVEITALCRLDEPVPTAYSEPPKTYLKQRMSPVKGVVN